MNAPFRFVSLLAVALLAAVGASAQDDVKKDPVSEKKKDTPEAKKDPLPDGKSVYRNVSAERLESVLKALNIDAQKSKGKNPTILFFDYAKNDYKIRLHWYGGRDLWIDAVFREKLSLEDINAWNRRAKFSRAVQLKGEKDTVSLEAQLDCVGGVTDGIIRQFLERFDGELAQFAKFVAK